MSLTITDWIARHRPVTSVGETIAEATPVRSRFARDEPAADAGSSQLREGERYENWRWPNDALERERDERCSL